MKSVNSYSSGSSQVLIPHIIGDYEDLTKRNVSWEQIAEASEIVLAFGAPLGLDNSATMWLPELADGNAVARRKVHLLAVLNEPARLRQHRVNLLACLGFRRVLAAGW